MVRLNKRLFNKRNFERAKEFANNAREAYDKYQFLQGEEPQEGLVPIGNSPFYMTPSEPASPFDCDRYPDSPYCGGNPINTKIVDIEVNLVRDECTLGIQFNGTLGFIKLPPFQFAYRNPACRLPEIPYISQTDTPYVPPPIGSGVYVFISSGDRVFEEVFNNGQDSRKTEFKWNLEFVSATYPIGESYPDNINASVICNTTTFYKNDVSWQQGDEEGITKDLTLNYRFKNGAIDPRWTTSQRNNFVFDVQFLQDTAVAVMVFSYEKAMAFVGTELGKNLKYQNYVSQSATDYQYTKFYRTWQVLEVGVNYFAPPPLKNLGDSMCCNETKQMMQLILKRLGDLPATVPTQLTDHSKGTKQVNSVSEFISYTVKQLDAIAGQFPVEIEIEDSDLTKKGNQKQIVKLPNIAESLAEMTGILLALRAESDANLNATIRGLIETGSAKQIAFQAYEYAKANAEFLAYKGKQIERKVPFLFKPGEQQLDKMLVEAEVKVKGWENDDKEDIKDLLYPVLELAAMWKAQNFRNLGTQSPKAKVKEMLELGLTAANLAKGVLSDDEKKRYEDALKKGENPKPPEKKDFNDFLEEVENGFTAQERISDNTNPYGYPRENRPLIREIGTTSGGQQ